MDHFRLKMTGEFVNVRDALYSVTGRLRNNLFSSKMSNGPGNRSTNARGNGYHSSGHTNLTKSMDGLKLSSNIDRPPTSAQWQPTVKLYFSFLLFCYLSILSCLHLLRIYCRWERVIQGWDMMLARDQLLLKVVLSSAGLHRIPLLYIFISLGKGI